MNPPLTLFTSLNNTIMNFKLLEEVSFLHCSNNTILNSAQSKWKVMSHSATRIFFHMTRYETVSKEEGYKNDKKKLD